MKVKVIDKDTIQLIVEGVKYDIKAVTNGLDRGAIVLTKWHISGAEPDKLIIEPVHPNVVAIK